MSFGVILHTVSTASSSTSENVIVEVEYRLTRFGPVVNHHSKILTLVAKLCGDSFHCIDEIQMNFRWSGDKILVMLPMDDKQVNRRQRRAIVKNDYIIVFIEDSRGRFSGEDLTKYARHKQI